MKKYLKFLPIVIILVLMIIAFATGGLDFFTFENLKAYNDDLRIVLGHNEILFPILFILIYILSTALSIPGGFFLTMLAGFLFGKYLATFYVAIGATIGACLLFLSMKTAIGAYFEKKASPYLKKVSKGLKKNAFFYLMFLRLLPIFPFWLVNILPAFFNIRFRTYLITTFFGILPGTFIYAQAGTALSTVLNQKEFKFSSVFTFEIYLTLILLALITLLPLVFKKIKERSTKK